jgi:hypothetical protein
MGQNDTTEGHRRQQEAIWAKKAKIPEKVIATRTRADYHNAFGETTYAATRASGA